MQCSRLDALICEQEHLSSLSRDALEAVQLSGLNRLLSREAGRSGFYKDLPEHLDSLSELHKLPFTTEEDLSRRAGGILLTSQSEIRRVLSDATSGTTGLPKRVFYTQGDLENTIRLYMAGLGELIFPGNRVMICFPFSGPFGLGELIAEAIVRLGAKPLKLGSAMRYQEYSDILDGEKPDCFVGMPVQLLSILRVCGKKSLRRALVSGDACPDSVTDACEAILGTSLFPHYGSREMGMAGAVTCPAHTGMHLRENHIIAEIVAQDGHVLPAGACGELVITTIGMEAMPLIRYRTGDLTRILPDACPCGSATRRLDKVKRASSGPDITELDEALYPFPQLVDYRADRIKDHITIEALVKGSINPALLADAAAKALPGFAVSVKVRDVCPEDTALYRGKRRILPASE